MPNAAKKVNKNAKKRLPVILKITTTKNTRTTRTTRTATVKTARTILIKQQETAVQEHTTKSVQIQTLETHPEQDQQKHKSCVNLINEIAPNSISITSTVNITDSKDRVATTAAQDYLLQQEQQQQNPANASKTAARLGSAVDLSAIEYANNELTTAATTLYPDVIESLQQSAARVATVAYISTASANVTETLLAPLPATASKKAVEDATILTTSSVEQINIVPTVFKRKTNKKSIKSLNNKITTKENCRLSTLRSRKCTSHVLPEQQQNSEQQLEQIKQQGSEEEAKLEEAKEGQREQKQHVLNIGTATGATTTETTAKTAAVCSYLDEASLNRIEPLECELKKASTKRKRGNSFTFSCASLTGGTRRRSSTRKNSQTSNITERTAYYCESAVVSNNNNYSATAAATKTAATSNSSSNTKKRPRIMSLYERRYQNDDGRGVVSNGYLNSTRNSSAASGVLQSDADTQDIANNQYYVASAASGAGGAAAALGGSSSALNHAPAMATLCNIGNTCYLNSVVYTLRFAPQFLHNLHHLMVDLSAVQQNLLRHRAKSSSLGRGMSPLNVESARSWSNKDLASLEECNSAGGSSACSLTQKSQHQLLSEKLHELYQSLHRNEAAESTEPYHADTLLHAIQDVSAIFEGNQQQDAHEFLMCLLNSVRETCQTLIKAISECPDVIMNGYINNPDELDAASACDRDSNMGSNNSHASSGSGGNGLSVNASSLSTSNITKSYFFSRKSKRKEEAKNSKNSRLQSPLKDGSGGDTRLQQPTSNSLFYLNTVDLSSAPPAPAPSNSNATKSGSGSGGGSSAGGDIEPSPLSALKDKARLAEKIRELGLDFFSEDFEGITVSTTKCLSCETITEQKESMIDIAVPVPISGYDSADYTEKPSSFIQNSCITREYFRGENKYRCEQCTGYTEAIRSISYEVLPRLLVIQLSRFSGGMEKINSYIPTSFTLQCFCAKCCELSDANKLHVYKLYSVITHVGATMSVGHYIAYTCSLDWAAEYVNCPKDRRSSVTAAASQQQGGVNGQHNSSSTGASGDRANVGAQSQTSSAASAAASALASSGTNLIKKMKFGRSKASSSGDMSKNMKNLNGITSKTITNGIGNLSMNTTCHSLSCCATRLCTVHQQQQILIGTNLNEEGSTQNGAQYSSGAAGNQFLAGYGSTGRGGAKNLYSSYSTATPAAAATSAGSCNISSSSGNAEPIWYMCDDDKIKAMTQREFEELLSPARKITITPYLLFYARFDLQPSSASTSTCASQPTPTKQTPSPQASWSNESLQSGSGASGSVKM